MPHLKIKISLFALIMILAPLSSLALSNDRTKPYYVTANEVSYFRNKHTTIYKGNVHATQGSTTLDSDTMIILTDGKTNAVIKLTAYGKPAHYSTLPNNQKTKLHARANTIIYQPKLDIVTLIQKAVVTHEKNVFSGPLIIYNIKKDTIVSKGSKKSGKTTVIIQPQSGGEL